jgi:CPA1 family monovalent cation:H+ antiporter
MTLFELSALLLTVAAICGFLNEKFIKLPTTIGLMLIASVFSIILLVAESLGSDMALAAEHIIAQIDFEETLMEGMLCFLLFAGALHMNLENLLSKVRIIGIMASVGVVLTTCLVGV